MPSNEDRDPVTRICQEFKGSMGIFSVMLLFSWFYSWLILPIWLLVCPFYVALQKSKTRYYRAGLFGALLGTIASISGQTYYFFFIGLELAIAYAICFQNPRERIVGAAIGTLAMPTMVLITGIFWCDSITWEQFIGLLGLTLWLAPIGAAIGAMSGTAIYNANQRNQE